jgi:hypothetical protein
MTRTAFPRPRKAGHDHEADLKIGVRLIVAACRALDLDPRSTGLAAGFARVKTIPRHAAAMAAVEVFGWSRARAADACGVSYWGMFKQTTANTIDQRHAVAKDAARELALQIAKSDAKAPTPAARARAALARRAEAVGLSLDAALAATSIMATRARRLAILDLVAEGMQRDDIADAFGYALVTVHRIASGAWPAIRVDRRKRENRAAPPSAATQASAC